MKRISILIADDHEVIRSGLSAIFSFQKDFVVVGQATNGIETVGLAMHLSPDVIVMDLVMPGLDGVAATKKIIAANPAAKILILTTYATSLDLRRVLEAGAVGAISKDTPNKDLIAAIRTIANGGRAVSPDIENQLAVTTEIPSLTERQIDVLTSIARGLTNQDIAHKLGISEDGVKAHIKTLLTKLDVSNRSEAAAYALKLQLIR